MNAKIAGPRPETLIRWSTIVAVSLVALIAAWISYFHTVAVVSAHGERGGIGRVYAGTIDGLIYAGSMVLLDCARRRIDPPKLAYAMLGSGITATLYVNIISGLTYGLLGSAVAAWPALALVGSFELLMYLVRSSAQAVVTDTPSAVVTDTAVVVSPHPVPDEPLAVVPATEEPLQDQAEAPKDRRPTGTVAKPRNRAQKPAKTPAERAQEMYGERVLSGDPVPSLRTVMDELHLGQPRAREAHRHLVSLTAASNGNGHANGGESL